MSATVEVVFYNEAVHQALPVDTVLAAAAIDRILAPGEPPPARQEAEILALLLRGHLAVLATEVSSLMEAAEQQDDCTELPVRAALDLAAHLLAAPPIYTARRTVSVVPLAHCCHDLHRFYAAAKSPLPPRKP
ncbi:DUF6415 family natural product biosynthesis protein [Streptomyces sp. NPDC054834]